MESALNISDPKPEIPRQEVNDGAKTLRFNIILGEGHLTEYQKRFPKTPLHLVSRIQIGLAGAVIVLQILLMCLTRYYTIVESTGVGFWGSISVALAGFQTMRTCTQISYKRLYTTLALQSWATICNLTLTCMVLANSIREQKYRLMDSLSNESYSSYDRVPLGMIISCIIFTGLLAFAGLGQLILSLYVGWKAATALCSRGCKFEYKTIPMDDSKVKSFGSKPPPAYAEISLEGPKVTSTSCPQL